MKSGSQEHSDGTTRGKGEVIVPAKKTLRFVIQTNMQSAFQIDSLEIMNYRAIEPPSPATPTAENLRHR